MWRVWERGRLDTGFWWGNLWDGDHLKKFSVKSVTGKPYFDLQNNICVKTAEVWKVAVKFDNVFLFCKITNKKRNYN